MLTTSTLLMTRPKRLAPAVFILLAGGLSWPMTGWAAGAPAGFPAVSDLPAQAGMPDPLIGADGKAITTAANLLH